MHSWNFAFMSKYQRLGISVAISIVIAAINVFTTISRNSIDFQQHPAASLFGALLVSPLGGLICYWVIGFLQSDNSRQSQQSTPGYISTSNNECLTKEEEQRYLIASQELEQDRLSQGVWAKAFSEADGDNVKARARYIRYRVAQLLAQSSSQPLPSPSSQPPAKVRAEPPSQRLPAPGTRPRANNPVALTDGDSIESYIADLDKRVASLKKALQGKSPLN